MTVQNVNIEMVKVIQKNLTIKVCSLKGIKFVKEWQSIKMMWNSARKAEVHRWKAATDIVLKRYKLAVQNST